MTEIALILPAVFAAVIAAVWAGLLVLAEEAPTVSPALGDRTVQRAEAVPLSRAIQISRLALIVFAGVGASAAGRWWSHSPGQAAAIVAVTTAFVYMVVDALPRAIAVLVPRLAARATPAARRSLVPFAPLLGLIGAVERGLQVLFPPGPRSRDVLGKGERDMLAGVLSLHDATVAEVMTPRLDLVAIEAGAGWRDLVELLRRSEHARMPVYDEDLDDIVGILYAKDLTPAVAGLESPPESWQELVRPPQFVPESKSLAVQLRDFQRGAGHLAIVVDEFGGTSGLVTLEDVLEEVVGEIHGEYDADEEPAIKQEGDDRYWVDGRVSLDSLSELLGTSIVREEVSTVGGLIYSHLGRVPRPGEELRIEDYRVVVEQVARRRIRRVYFERLADTSTVEAGIEERK